LLGLALPVAPPLLSLLRNITADVVTLHPLDHRAAVVVAAASLRDFKSTRNNLNYSVSPRRHRIAPYFDFGCIAALANLQERYKLSESVPKEEIPIYILYLRRYYVASPLFRVHLR
jgi:hypothetical protein